MVRKIKAEQPPIGEAHPVPQTQMLGLCNTVQQEPISSGSTIRDSGFSMQVDMDISDDTVTGGKAGFASVSVHGMLISDVNRQSERARTWCQGACTSRAGFTTSWCGGPCPAVTQNCCRRRPIYRQELPYRRNVRDQGPPERRDLHSVSPRNQSYRRIQP